MRAAGKAGALPGGFLVRLLLCWLLACGAALASPFANSGVPLTVELLATDAAADAVELARGAQALPSDGEQVTLPYRDTGSWVRVIPGALPEQPVLVVESIVSGPVTLVLPDGQRLTRSKLQPRAAPETVAYALVFPLPQALARDTPLLMHLSHRHRAHTRIKLFATQEWRLKERTRLVTASAIYAALAAFAVIAACYWAVLRDRMFGDYTLYLLALLTFTASNSGFIYGWPGGVWWARLGIHGQWGMVALAIGLSLGFTRHFLALQREAPRLAPLFDRLRLAMLTSGAVILLSPLPLPYAGMLLSLAMLSAYFLLFGTAVHVARRGNRYAVYYVVGWAPLTASATLRALQGMGFSMPFEAEYLYGASAVWQALVLTLGIADQVLAFRRERDIARQAAAQAEQLEVQNAYLKENVRLREEVERMSRHDLKTPLTSIVAVPRLVREAGPLSDDQKELLAMVERAGYRVLNLVNLSLDLLKMEQGVYRFQPAAVDLGRLLHKVVGDLGTLAGARSVALGVRIDGRPPAGAAPVRALAEETLCYSILANLLKNAVEAAPEGSTVTVAVESGDPVWVRIHNLGAVPEAVRHRFFEKYATAGKTGGSGFGTYSARLMARIQEGEVSMRTGDAEGTTLSLRLRSAAGQAAEPPRPPDTPPRAAAGPEGALPALKVLVVDDDEYNLLVMRRSLPSPPLALRTAMNGRAALEMQAAQAADVIFMDLEMPVMNGFEAVALLRAREKEARSRPTLVVALSSHEDEATRSRCLKAGFDLYLTKPVTREDLYRVLRGASVPAGALPAVPPALPLPGPDSALVLDPDLRDTLPAFLRSRRQALDEMERSLRDGDLAAVRRLAHRLAGSFALHGFRWAAHRCQGIERVTQEPEPQGLDEQLAALRRHLDTVEIGFADAETQPLA